MRIRQCLFSVFLPLFLGACVALENPDREFSPLQREAYEYNRRGMVNMSMALFDEAIVEFKKASALFEDYQIRGQELMYTPIFMTAWAYEKMGETQKACRFFALFLEVSPQGYVEDTKAEHAESFLAVCRD